MSETNTGIDLIAEARKKVDQLYGSERPLLATDFIASNGIIVEEVDGEPRPVRPTKAVENVDLLMDFARKQFIEVHERLNKKS